MHEPLTPHSAAMSRESHHCEGGYLQELTNLPLHLLSEHTAKSSTVSLKPNMIPVHQLALVSEWEWVSVLHFYLSSSYTDATFWLV